MRAWTLSLLLCAPPAASAPALRADCGPGRLDLPCPAKAASWARIETEPPRRADAAYALEFGGAKRDGEPALSVKLGNWARQALFWTAVVTTFLL